MVFTNYKTWIFIVKTVKNTQAKGKSKCVTCLTEGTFIHEIEDKYDLKVELEIYLQFFTD